MSLFIAGTDTGVGKTHITCLILETLRKRGVDAVGYKPVACGDREDAKALAAASGGLELNEVNPVWLSTAVAPYVAGLLENRTVGMQDLLDGFESMSREHEEVLVEGAGGWEVPLAPKKSMSDLAVRMGLPVLLVVGNRLGALNHALLSLKAIRDAGLKCVGIVLNQLDDELNTAMITNKGVLEDLSGVPLLEHVIHGQEFLDETWMEDLGLIPSEPVLPIG